MVQGVGAGTQAVTVTLTCPPSISGSFPSAAVAAVGRGDLVDDADESLAAFPRLSLAAFPESCALPRRRRVVRLGVVGWFPIRHRPSPVPARPTPAPCDPIRIPVGDHVVGGVVDEG